MKQRFTPAVATGLAIAALPGCATMSENETAGTILGGGAGAVVGNQFGKGSGRTAEIGESITWENPDNADGPAHGSATVVRQGRDRTGRTCREFQQTVTIGGREEHSYGTACCDENGDWKLTT